MTLMQLHEECVKAAWHYGDKPSADQCEALKSLQTAFRSALSSTLEPPAELLQLHRDAVNACVSWKLGEVTEGDAVKVEAAFRDALSRAIEPREKRELRLIKDCEELTEVIAALQAEAQAVAPADVREITPGQIVAEFRSYLDSDTGFDSAEKLHHALNGLLARITAHGTAQRAAGVEAAAMVAEEWMGPKIADGSCQTCHGTRRVHLAGAKGPLPCPTCWYVVPDKATLFAMRDSIAAAIRSINEAAK